MLRFAGRLSAGKCFTAEIAKKSVRFRIARAFCEVRVHCLGPYTASPRRKPGSREFWVSHIVLFESFLLSLISAHSAVSFFR
jgi:hypothetical protein